jgi:lysophospholipase L1-like esterase
MSFALGLSLRVPGLGLGRGNVSYQPYKQKVLDQFATNMIAYWPMDETTGAAAVDSSGNSRNAAYTGVTLANADFVSDGKAPYLDGATSYISFYSASLATAFNGAEGTLAGWFKIAAAEWVDNTNKQLFAIYINDNNRIIVYKGSSNTRIPANYVAGGVNKSVQWLPLLGPTSWFHYAMTWSKSGEIVKSYINGHCVAQATTLGDWAGSPGTNQTLIGAFNKTPTYPFLGYAAHSGLWSAALTGDQLKTMANLAVNRLAVTIIGDSIPADNAIPSWAHQLGTSNDGNSYTLFNLGVSGHSIMANMDADVVLAAIQDADIIILTLGTNDNNAGDMTALQAEVEENIIELKASNTNATIYYMNVLPRSTDKALIRGAIAAACTAQSITCWDTTGWIDPTIGVDTSDGLHPNAAGHAKILAQVQARL